MSLRAARVKEGRSLILMMDKLKRFFEGRYGMDTLGIAITIAAMLFALAGNIAQSFIVQIPVYLLIVWELVRYMSRDRSARYRENEQFVKYASRFNDRFLKPIAKWYKLQKNRFRDRKTHKYFLCPKCKSALRVPKGRGEITITCPVCKEKLDRKI